MANTQPRFINPHPFKVHVLDPDGLTVTVQPYSHKDFGPDDGVYVLEGAHYADQIQPHGSLAPFPAETPVATADEDPAGEGDEGGDEGGDGADGDSGAGSDSGGDSADQENAGEGAGAGEGEGGDDASGDGEGGSDDEMTIDEFRAALDSLTNKELPAFVEPYGIVFPDDVKTKKARVAYAIEELGSQ